MYVTSDKKYIFFFLVVSPSVDRFYKDWLESEKNNTISINSYNGLSIVVDIVSGREAKDEISNRIEMRIDVVSGARFSLRKKEGSDFEVVAIEQTREINFRYSIPSEKGDEKEVFHRPKFSTSDDERAFGAWSSKGIEFAVPLEELDSSVGEEIRISVEEGGFRGIRLVKDIAYKLKQKM